MRRTHAGVRLVLGCAVALAAAGCETVIERGLTEEQANDVIVALEREGIGASKEAGGRPGEGGYALSVPRDDVARALVALRARDLPRTPDPGFEEVFGEGSLVPTATEERGRYATAVAGELSRTIESIDGVLDARVHVAVPDPRDFALDDARPHPRASVLVRRGPGRVAVDEGAIRALVAGAVEGMAEGDVSVVMVDAPRPPSPATHPLAKVGPVWVSRGSANLLRALFAAAALAGMLLAAGLVVVWRRRRPSTPRGPAPTPAPRDA